VAKDDDESLGYARPFTPSGQDAEARTRFIVNALVIAFLIFTTLAIGAFHLPRVGERGHELSFRRSVFAAVNATTLTGFQQDVGSTLPGADVLRLILTIGGTLFTLTAGGILVSRAARMGYSGGQVAAAAAVTTLVATVGGAACLIDSERGLVASLLTSSSAFGNSGLFAGVLPDLLSWRTHVVLLPLATAGGLGLPVVMEMFDRITGARTRLSTHSRRALALTAAAYLFGVLAIFLLGGDTGSGHRAAAAADSDNWREQLASASAFSLNARTAGLPLESVRALARPAQWVVFVLMIVGGCPGGTAGGLKTTTLWRLFTGIGDALRGRRAPASFGIAACWVMGYFLTAVVGFVLLMRTEPDISADRLLFLAFSALGNCGLWHDPISVTGNGLFTLSAMMLIGRLAPIGVLWWLVRRGGDEEAEPVAIG
jgi:trk system potassium uptake protein TrkH